MLNIYEAFHADPGYFKTLRVNDNLLINYNCPQMETWANLLTSLNHIIYTIEGERKIVRPEKSINATEGSLIFLRKGAFQQGKFHQEDWQVIVFAIHDSYIRSFINEFRDRLRPQHNMVEPKKESLFTIDTNEITKTYFNGLLPYFTKQPPPQESLLELKLRELLFSILFDKANSTLLSYLDNIVNDYNAAFIEIMESNYMFDLSLSELAKLSGHSLTTFKTIFSKIFSTSPGKWIIQKRLESACRMLYDLQKPINDIAFESGFKSVTHFNRVFKIKFKQTPSDFRKQLKSTG